MRRFSISLLLVAGLVMGLIGEASASVAPGSKCAKAGTKTISKGKTYTCIKLGKNLYWNNGVKVSITSRTKAPTVANLQFYQTHRTSISVELLEISISTAGALVTKKVLTSAGAKVGLRIIDMRSSRLLLEVDRELYILQPGGTSAPLGIETIGGVPSDSRSLNAMRLSIDGRNIYAFDLDMDFYNIDISGSTPSWTRLFTGPQFKSALKLLGGDQEFDWIQEFEIVSVGEILVMTKNSYTGTLRFWSVTTSLTSTESPRIAKIGEYQSSNVLISDAAYMSISPDGSKIAIMHTASALTPKSKILLYSIEKKVFVDFPSSRLYEGNNYFLSWLGESKLLMTIDQVWSNDKDGGRVTCLLNLITSEKCKNINGVSGGSLVGKR